MNIRNCAIAGDWHGDTPWARFALKKIHLAHVTEIIHVGDFGLWPGEEGIIFLNAVHEELESFGQTLYVTLGNHDDYTQFEALEAHPEMENFVYNPEYPRILIAKRGARWIWSGVSFVSLGGAASIDFEGRIEGINWWASERITVGDVYRTIAGGEADVMITHDAPKGVELLSNHRDSDKGWSQEALAYADDSRSMVRHALDGVKPSMLFHGHYHHYIDRMTTLTDGTEEYTYRHIGLDMNGYEKNISILDLSDMSVDMILTGGEKIS